MAVCFGCYDSHSNSITCPRCGRVGTIIWETVSTPDGDRKDLVGIEGGFYERLSNCPPYPIELVCEGCGGVPRG
jgi:hypothetical protein